VADGCTDLITNSNVVWTLLGAPIKGLKDGDQVEVTGQPAVHLETPCRGSPLAVLTVKKM
jgi:hypothetical protein